jgi:hypothetical protein
MFYKPLYHLIHLRQATPAHIFVNVDKSFKHKCKTLQSREMKLSVNFLFSYVYSTQCSDFVLPFIFLGIFLGMVNKSVNLRIV